MKRVFFLLAAGLMITGNLLAQNPGQDFTNRMNHIFQYVDKSKVTTGLLSDYGLQFVEPKYFNGVPADSNYVDMDTWRMLYSGMFSSKINNNVSLADPETIFDAIDNATHAIAVPVVMMHYQYNALNEDALNPSKNMLKIVNGDQLQDVQGGNSPYLVKQLFAVAPKELHFESNVACFVFNSTLLYSNVSKTIQKREIKFDNQTNYILANPNTQVSHSFTTGGVKTIYFRLTYTDGTSYTSQTKIYVTDPGSSLKNGVTDFQPHDSIEIKKNSLHSGGWIQISYASNNTAKKIKKPLIVAEGFDPYPLVGKRNNNIRDFLNNDIKLGAPSPTNSSGGRTLYADLDLADYDIVYLDYNNGVDDIWRNAQLFKQVIKEVNTRKQSVVGAEPNIVMGLSMGGLVARIALRQLETEGYNHQTKKYISVDSPHKGANMPVGFQAAVRHIENMDLRIPIGPLVFFPIWSAKNMDAAKGIIKLINSEAAKQMLIYYVKSNNTFDNSIHIAFQTAYDNLGYPQQTIENISISNGSANGALSFPPGSPIIDYQLSYNFKWWMDLLSLYSGLALITIYPKIAWNTIPGHSQVKAEINIDGLKNQTVSRVYKGKVYIRKKILFLIPVDITLEDKTLNSESYMLPLDGAPGGMFNISDFANNLPFPSTAIKQSKFCFIPTGSSLGLSSWTNLTQTITSSTPKPSYLNAIFTQNNNEAHVDFHSPALFLLDKLNIPYITGNEVITSASSFSLVNPPSTPVYWTSSNTGIFTVASPGNPTTVTPGTGLGSATLSARTVSNSGKVVATKIIEMPPIINGYSTICTGMPFTLSNGKPATWSVSNGFSVSPAYGVTTTITPASPLIGQSGTVTAVWNGLTITKPLQSCDMTYIDGPSAICAAGGVYKLNTNQSATWSVSNGFSVSTATGTSTTVTANAPNGQTGTVTAVANGKTYTKTIQACDFSISGPDKVCSTATYTLTNGAQATYWGAVPPSLFTILSSSATSFTVQANSTIGTMGAIVANLASGGSLSKPVTATCSKSYSNGYDIWVYPNPVDDILYIEIDVDGAAKVLGMSSNRGSSKLIFDIRLYDGQGSLLRQQKTKDSITQFNVATLRAGIYYLHIYDGVSETPYMQIVIVGQ